MRRVFTLASLLVALATSGPASAMLVSAGAPSFEVDWSCNSNICNSPTNTIPSSTLSSVATFSNFSFNGAGTALSFHIAIQNNTPQGSFSATDWASVRLVSFGFDTLPDATSVSETGASVFTGIALETNFPGFQKVDVCAFSGQNCSGGANDGLHPVGSGATPTDDAFTMTLSGLPAGTTSVDLGTEFAGGTELFDVRFQTNLGSFEFQNSACTRGTLGCGPTDTPEPGTLALLGTFLAVLGLAFTWRRHGVVLQTA